METLTYDELVVGNSELFRAEIAGVYMSSPPPPQLLSLIHDLCFASRPGVCLVVSGPGLIHALGGMANANMNCW